jgi:hypothetical protein
VNRPSVDVYGCICCPPAATTLANNTIATAICVYSLRIVILISFCAQFLRDEAIP